MNNALIVVDVQKNFIRSEMAESLVYSLAAAVVPIYKIMGSLIFYTKDYGIKTFNSVDIVDELSPDPGYVFGYDCSVKLLDADLEFYNRTPSGQRGASLFEALEIHGIESVDIVGIGIDTSMLEMAEKLVDLGYKVTIPEQFCIGFFDSHFETDFPKSDFIEHLQKIGVRVI